MNCPNCNTLIENEDIYLQKDIAKCRACNHVFKISKIVVPQRRFDAHLPPDGVWYYNDFENKILGASMRSKATLLLIPFMMLWSGLSLGNIYGSQIINNEFNPILSFLGIPFILISIILLAVAVFLIVGKVEVTFNNEAGKIFTGVGKIGLTKSFLWKDIDTVEEGISTLRRSSKSSYVINLVGQCSISFGNGLSEERRYYIIDALRDNLKNKK